MIERTKIGECGVEFNCMQLMGTDGCGDLLDDGIRLIHNAPFIDRRHGPKSIRISLDAGS